MRCRIVVDMLGFANLQNQTKPMFYYNSIGFAQFDPLNLDLTVSSPIQWLVLASDWCRQTSILSADWFRGSASDFHWRFERREANALLSLVDTLYSFAVSRATGPYVCVKKGELFLF